MNAKRSCAVISAAWFLIGIATLARAGSSTSRFFDANCKLMESELELRAEEKAWIKRKKDLLRRALAELEN